MVAEGRELVQQWWVATFPGCHLSVVMGFNFVGDGIRGGSTPMPAADEQPPRSARAFAFAAPGGLSVPRAALGMIT
jgi:hypothetical protein